MILGIISCSSDYKIDKKDFSLIPYNGKEILVYKSSENKLDTIFLKGFDQYSAGSDPLAFFPDHYEIYRLNCKRSDPNYDRYLEGKSLVELGASESGQTYISFDIKLKGSWFYNLTSFSKKEFDSIPLTELNIDNKLYKDVKVFEADGSYEQRDNYVERFYWSISQGFLGLDKRETEWRLIKKYVP